ncbi:MAG: hypothetical protein AB7E80_06865 [Hyphomicrobiaceae bacterium]
MQDAAPRSGPAIDDSLPAIPLIDVGPDFAVETLERDRERAQRLLDSATQHAPTRALSALDTVSRRWLARWNNAHLDEIDRVAGLLQRPGAYFLSVNYEWGCTCRVGPSPDGTSARLVRVLDWRTEGLGRHLMAARVAGKSGAFVTLTWPGYTGVLQAVARGRFAAALNQAPMRKALGYYYLDWAANRRRIWAMPHDTPSHVLRHAFEAASSYAEAKRILTETPVSSPAIYSLAGLAPGDTCTIERRETEARVHEGAQVAANHWQAFGWHGHPRGIDSAGRACRMAGVSNDFDTTFGWLAPPILNDLTRIVMIADASSGRFIARGHESSGPATQVLEAVA